MIELILSLQLYWSDADSGRLPNGDSFRLHNVDASETWKPDCERERAAGYEAKAAIVEHAHDKPFMITRIYNQDTYGRVVIDISIEGEDVATWLIDRGHAQAWKYDTGQSKPDWCYD
ncbi:MAG: thermonuclease family protein [Henriciella sp.]|jgi:endonuclease YncB( thermonuclease family)